MFNYYFGSKDNSIKNILSYNQAKLNTVFVNVLYKHLKMFNEIKPRKVQFTGKDLVIYGLIELLILNTSMSTNQIEIQVLKHWNEEECKINQSTSNDKSRQRKKINEIIKRLQLDERSPIKKMKFNNTFSSWLESFIVQSDIKKADYKKFGYGTE